MRGRVRIAALLATVALIAVGAAGCGDDDEDEGVSIPSISIPEEGTPETTTAAPPTTTGTVPESGGASPGQQQGSGEDGASGATPQERFEQFCKQNPGACGD